MEIYGKKSEYKEIPISTDARYPIPGRDIVTRTSLYQQVKWDW